MTSFFWQLIVAVLVLSCCSHADNVAFDLPGPKIEVRVTRAGRTLPISEVPNLRPGDRLWLHPEISVSRSVHYLLIVAFLRGSTNPPPEQWFTRAETWSKEVRQGGIVVTVPEGAEQALLFLAPETGGDFSTLRSAVSGRPGAFVRASQDLNQAALDRSRLDKYITGVREAVAADPKELHERSLMLARSLKIKVDEQCFDKPTQEQAPCLTRSTDQLVLDDSHGQSMVAALTSGPGSDLAGAISSTKIAGGGAYSPYVGAVVDLARMMENFHTAQYQYIPALALPSRDELSLRLNNPPSFHNPISVLVVGLPAIGAAQLPAIRAVEPKKVSCLQRKELVLPVEGAPLAFSTSYMHDVTLQIETKGGGAKAIGVPAMADAVHGGFVVDTQSLDVGDLEPRITGSLRGQWGFEPFTGPTFELRIARSAKWLLASSDTTALIVGRKDSFHLKSEEAPCVDDVTIKDQNGKLLKAVWKPLKADELEVEVPLQDQPAGSLLVLVGQSTLAKPDEIQMQTYFEAAHLDHFSLNEGDQQGILKGTRLDQVGSLKIGRIRFVPGGLTRADGKDELSLSMEGASVGNPLIAGQDLVAHVALKDGRVLDLDATINPPRPQVTLLRERVKAGTTPSTIRLSSEGDLPQGGQVSFFLKTEMPAAFPRNEKIEVGTEDGSAGILLSLTDGTLFLEDSQTLLATLQPLKAFGPSVFGPLRFRPVAENGEHGDWHSLAKLVRIPTLKEVHCPDSPNKQCSLIGENLFLLASVSSDSQFADNVAVPADFVDSSLSVPRPNGTVLYIKLRDDPSAVNKAVLPVFPESSVD